MENRNGRPAGNGRTSAGGQPGRTAPARRQGAPSSRATPPPQRAPQNGKAKRPKSKNRWFRAIVMVLATVGFCVFLAVFLLQSALDMFGLNQEDHQIEVTIPEKATLQQVSSILVKAGVVDRRLTFQIFAGLKPEESRVYKSGNYLLNSNMGYDEILRDLRTGQNQSETVEITFIEGRNIYEIASLLEENKVCEAEAFINHLQTTDFGFEFMDQLPENALRYRRLEGYIFPDTYQFLVGENVDEVARKFLKNFNAKVTTQMRNRMRDLNLTLDEAITLASIIQKETGGVGGIDEMKRVSSVFHNRLNLKAEYPKLQSDVTRNYVNYFIIPFHDTRNQEMYDAYNTYVCDGLPVGAICNPGIDAINAALYPDDTPYYFFVTDVQNQFYYAETAQQHYQNVATASRVEGEGIIHGIDTE